MLYSVHGSQMRKPPGGPKRDYYDEERLHAIAEIRRALPDILEYGTEDDFVELVKKWRKNISADELRDWIKLFRASVREKRGLD
jgi:hypothetical protein